MSQTATYQYTEEDVEKQWGELLDILAYLLDELVNALQALWLRCLVAWQEVVSTVLVEQAPELLQEAVATVDTIGIPRLAGFYRTQEQVPVRPRRKLQGRAIPEAGEPGYDPGSL